MLKHYTKIALAVYLIISLFALHFYSPDEYFQILGFAKYKLGIMPEMSTIWELTSKARSSFQPTIVYSLFKAFDPFIRNLNLNTIIFVNTFLKLASAILSVFCINQFIKAFIPTIENKLYKKWFILLTFFSYLTVFLGVHFSADGTSVSFILLGLSLSYNINTTNKKDYLTGFIFGLAFLVRYQDLFLIFGVLSWLLLINQSSFIRITRICFALLITYLGLGLCVDRWFYGEWTFAIYNYSLWWQKSHLLGTFGGSEPWYYYITHSFILLPYGPLYFLSIIVIILYKRRSIITWAIFPYLLVHCLIGHKEMRFLAPVNALMPLIMLYALEILIKRFNFQINQKYYKYIKITWYLNCLTLILIALPSPTILQALNIAIKYKKPTIIYYTGNPIITAFPHEISTYSRYNLKPQYTTDARKINCPINHNCLLLYFCPAIDKTLTDSLKLVSQNCYGTKNTILNIYSSEINRTNIYEIKNIEVKQ